MPCAFQPLRKDKTVMPKDKILGTTEPSLYLFIIWRLSKLLNYQKHR